MQTIVKRILLVFSLLAMIAPVFAQQVQAKEDVVYRVPVTKEVEKGLYAFLNRSIKEAEEADASAIILDMHTPGGFVDAAGNIAKLIDSATIPVYTYINDDALSAGAYLALYADDIYMSPRGRIGAAQVIDSSGNAADKKADSAWLSAMKNAAKSSKHHRDPLYAQAMADASLDLPEYGAKEGELLTLTASDAEKVGYSEGTMESFEELLAHLNLQNAKVIEMKETATENIARFITNPIVVPILLSIAGLGLVVELYSPGFGVPGTMAISALLLFFYGHLIAGFAGYEAILLFAIGAVLLIAELFISGGIAGIIGLIAVVGSIILAGANPMYMATSVLIAVAIATVGAVILIKFFGKKLHLLNRFVLMDATDTESGYVSNEKRSDLIGQVGTTLTPLRPSGTVDLNGTRIDVVSEGGYIDNGQQVVIVKTEGSWIVVREHQSQSTSD